ncbi:MAG: M90 family metallopeptidase [Ilumatobacter sp.]|uniref:M90 family metallopeptidase n=1 Tax=Ilumatobacter sp. TaxID=1967498 RepID=UPI0032967F8F
MLSTLRSWFTRPAPEFDPAWESILREKYAHWSILDTDELARMRMLTARFIADNDWEAAQGMKITTEVQVLIAAQASMLLLGLEIDEFFDVTSIIVHTSTVRLRGTRRSAAGTMSDGVQHLAGQATPKGPVVLSWSAVKRGALRPDAGENVTYHEFAHRLDMLDGITDGTPPLGSDEATTRWAAICTPAFERVQTGDSVLRNYAATNIAEFFAVATEAFLNRPDVLVVHEPDLYAQLRSFYGQDPAARLSRTTIA